MDGERYTEEAFLRALGNEVRLWRQERRLSREELAARAGISPSTLGRIERASGAATSVGDVWRLATSLGIDFTDLVRRAEDAAVLASSGEAAGKVVHLRPARPMSAESRDQGLRYVASARDPREEQEWRDD
jgi:transcriptional regulator with XRE-family HTH domain